MSQQMFNEAGTELIPDQELIPPLVMNWPEAKLEMEGLTGRVLRAEQGVVMFMEAHRDVVVPSHHHGAQWGVVLSGTMELTMGGRTNVYHSGDVHFIPAGVEHEAKLLAGWRGLYIFESSRTQAISRKR